MNFNALKFYNDHGIETASHGHKRTRSGWIQIHCPFCRVTYGLGCHIESGAFNCWYCGTHNSVEVIQVLLNCNKNAALQILQQYKGRPLLRNDTEFEIQPQRRRECKWPPGTGPMENRHRAYLQKRQYDDELLEQVFNLKGTGPAGDYNHRIILPIYLDGKMISFQGRDITGKREDNDKYRACAQRDEALDHKHSLYGIDLAQDDAAVIVEGAADVWRLGPGAIGTFGTGFTRIQQELFRKRFQKGFVLFDPEPIAIKTAERCAYELSALGVIMELIELDEGDDPGDVSQDDANHIMRELGLKGWN